MPKIHKFRDWRGWLDGLRSKAMKAGAESLSTNFTALLATNGLANLGIESLHGIGMNWKTAIATAGIQFAVRTGAAAAAYVANKPDPDEVTETIDSDPAAFTKPPNE